MSAPSATRVLWRNPWKLVGNAWVLLPIGLGLSTCLIGLPIAARALKILARLMATNARELRGQRAPYDPEQTYAGSISVSMLLGFAVAMLVGGVVVEQLASADSEVLRLAAILAGGTGAAVALGAASATLLFAPIVAVGGVRGFFAPFGRSFELAASRGARASLWTGASVGAVYGLTHAVFAIGGYLLADGDDAAGAALLCGPLAVSVATPRALARLANVWADVEVVDGPPAPAPSDAKLRGLAWLIAPALVAVGGAFAVAAVVPMPMESGAAPAPQRRGLHPDMLGGVIREGRLPGTSVWVRVAERGVVVEAEDGGGAGAIDADFDTSDAWLFVDRSARVGAAIPEYRVAVSNGERWAWTNVDADGVRVDDSLARRTFGRLGRLGSGGLGIGALLLLFLTFTVGVELGAARTMQAPLLLDGQRESGALAALEGTIRVADGSRLLYTPPPSWAVFVGADRARLRVEGEAWIEAADGAIRFRFPDVPVEVIGGGDLGDWSGAHVVLLSRFPSSGLAGLRQASSPWPADGRLTLGSRDDARGVLVERAVRRAARVALPMLAGFGVAVATLLLSL